MSRALKKLNIRHKKLNISSPSKEKDEVKKTIEYLAKVKQINPEHLIFIDESGANLQMYPLYGRSYGKERAVLSSPHHPGNHITMIGAISLKK